MKKNILLLCYLLANLILFSQQKTKWKQISLNDFKIDYKIQYPTDNAIILKEKGEYYFNEWREELRLFYHIKRRIKILDTAGLKYAKIVIPYIWAEHTEDFAKISGYTYNIENGKVKKYRLKQRYIKTEKISDKIAQKIITFPKVKPGSIIEIDYILTTLNIVKLRPWYFQHYNLPTLYSEFSFNLPDFIKYRFEIIGQKDLKMAKKEENYTHINFIFHYNDPIPPGLGHYPQNFTTTVNFDLQGYLFTYIMENQQPFKPEPLIDAPINYIKSINFDLIQITQKIGYYTPFEQFVWEQFTRRVYQSTIYEYHIISPQRSKFITYPPGFIIYKVSSWEDLNQSLLKDEFFGLQLTRFWNAEQIINKIISENQTQLQKIITLYRYVRDNYQWNNIYSLFTSDNLTQIYKQKKGNSADINFSLIYLLRKANIKAYPVIIKTVDRGHIKKDLPTIYQFNNVICAVEYEGNYILLDAIDKKRPWFILNKNDLNGQGYLIDSKKHKWIPIANPIKSTIDIQAKLNYHNDSLNYNIDITMKGKFATENINKLFSYQPKLKQKITINSYTYYQQAIIKVYNTNTTYNRLFINPLTILNIKNPFTDNIRTMPIYFSSPYSMSIQMKVKIPDGYLLTTMPKSFAQTTDGIRLIFRSDYDTTNVILKLDFMIEKDFFMPSQYNDIRNIFSKLETIKKAQLIFIKN